jgi:tyrosine-protein phosphatase SIW14
MGNKYLVRTIISIFLSFFLSGGYCLAEVTTETSAEEVVQYEWASLIEREGLPNLHKVSEELYRGAQPTAEGMKELKKLGIKTVINLRAFHSDRDEIGETELDYEHIPIPAWRLKEEHVIQFLKLVTDKSRTPVFVHCMHGADRTGVMSAIHRIVIEGWPKEEAIEEMTKGGFGFHKIWKNLIKIVEDLNIEEIKKKAAIESKQDGSETESE